MDLQWHVLICGMSLTLFKRMEVMDSRGHALICQISLRFHSNMTEK